MLRIQAYMHFQISLSIVISYKCTESHWLKSLRSVTALAFPPKRK